MAAKDLIQEWRTWFLIAGLLAAFIAIAPHYATGEDGQTSIATNIKKGLDLQGGARILIQPDFSGVNDTQQRQDILTQVKQTLNGRLNAYGLEDVQVRQINSLTGQQSFIMVEMAGANQSQLSDLLARQGNFEASFSLRVQDNDTITFGNTDFRIRETAQGLTIDGQTLTPNNSITLATANHEIPVRYVNQTGDNHILHAQAFSGQDITGVNIDPTTSQVTPAGGTWQFQFQVSVTREAAERFQAVAQNFQIQGQYLAGTQLILMLDGEQMSSLNVAGSFKDQVINTPLISGGAESREQAIAEKRELESILQSGSLPVPVDIVSTNNVSGTLGEEFIQIAILSIILAVIGVSIVLFIRFQNPKIVLPMILTGFSEVFMLLAVFSQADLSPLTIGIVGLPILVGLVAGFRKGDTTVIALPLGYLLLLGLMRLSFSLDLAAIAGIIAAVGTGVDDQIIIADERGEHRIQNIKKRIKRAFFVIFVSAASTIGAMFPLMFIGAGSVKGFALTTIIGVVIGVSVTRPAFAKILEYIDA